MLLPCLIRNSLKQIAVNSTKNVIFSNHLKMSSCVGNLEVLKNNRPPLCSTKLSQLVAVKHLSTSPVSRSEHGDHSKIWTAERALALGLLGVLPAGLMMPCQFLDSLMALSVVMHMHWGIEAIVIDYVRPVIFGPVIPKIGLILVYAMSIATLAGLFNFIFNDMDGVKMMEEMLKMNFEFIKQGYLLDKNHVSSPNEIKEFIDKTLFGIPKDRYENLARARLKLCLDVNNRNLNPPNIVEKLLMDLEELNNYQIVKRVLAIP